MRSVPVSWSDRRRSRSPSLALVAASLAAGVISGCAASPRTTCNGLAADICSQSVDVAVASLPTAVRSRSLTAAFVQAGDPADPRLCATWGWCDHADAVWVVILTYGDEYWPVLAVRRVPGDPIQAAKPFSEPTQVP